MQFSSKPQFNDDPAPYVVTLTKRTPFTNPMTTGSMDEFVREDGRLHAPRPEFARPQHNPTNPILTEFRGASSVYSDAGHEFLLAVSHYLSYLNSDVYGWAEEHKDHARRVLSRLAAS